MPAVSVVIPCFRGGSFFREAVDSVRAQTLEDWELLVVSDGSAEDFSEIESSDPRIHIIRRSHRGVAITRNVGVELARSNLIAFLDDDDRMLPNRLAAQVDAMRDEKIGICHSQFRYIDERGVEFGVGIAKDCGYMDFLFDEGEFLFGSMTMRRDRIQEAGGFSPLLPFCEDLELVYRIARVSEIRFLPEILTEYRRHSSNATPSVAGGAERKIILTEHLLLSKAKGEFEYERAARTGISFIPTGRAERAIRFAHMSRMRRNYVGLVWGLGVALLVSPRVTLKLSYRQTMRRRQARRAAVLFAPGNA